MKDEATLVDIIIVLVAEVTVVVGLLTKKEAVLVLTIVILIRQVNFSIIS